jgi:3-hydroxyisobutyrate dehydrogenase-like beta-hydroxyacid dehydrogenase
MKARHACSIGARLRDFSVYALSAIVPAQPKLLPKDFAAFQEFRRESMTASPMSVACLGLGRIGAGIARSVQNAGHRLVVYNRTPQKTQPLVAAGATAARSPREAAAEADVVITCLMDDRSVLDNTTGENGILAGMRQGAIHIGTSTITPKATTRLAEMHAAHGSHYVAGPVAGHPVQAAAGKLITFVAGRPEVIERCRPVLEAYTAKIILLGDEPARAASFKLVVNFFAACLLETFGEAFVFAEKQGLDVMLVSEMFKEVLHHPAFPVYMDKIRTRSFDVLGSTLDGAGSKDVRFILESAAEVGVPLPIASIVRDKIIAAQAHGWGELDWSVFTEIARLNAGQEQMNRAARTA